MKDSISKTKYHLVPMDSVEEMAKVLEFGAKKYGDRQWEKGMAFSELYSAILRHAKSFFQDGEDRDSESQLLHAAHIMCNAAFLVRYQTREIEGIDDRPSVNHAYRPNVDHVEIIASGIDDSETIKFNTTGDI